MKQTILAHTIKWNGCSAEKNKWKEFNARMEAGEDEILKWK